MLYFQITDDGEIREKEMDTEKDIPGYHKTKNEAIIDRLSTLKFLIGSYELTVKRLKNETLMLEKLK